MNPSSPPLHPFELTISPSFQNTIYVRGFQLCHGLVTDRKRPPSPCCIQAISLHASPRFVQHYSFGQRRNLPDLAPFLRGISFFVPKSSLSSHNIAFGHVSRCSLAHFFHPPPLLVHFQDQGQLGSRFEEPSQAGDFAAHGL